MSSPPSRIPVIDISGFSSGDPRRRVEVVSELSRACEDLGFFVVTGHGVDESLIGHAVETARAFFDLPEATKRQVRDSGEVLGGLMYFPFRAESLAATLGEATPEDLKESLDFGPGFRGDPWPGSPSGLERALRDYYRALEGLAAGLRRIFMAAVGLPEDYIEDKFDRHLSSVRILNYPDQRRPPLPGQLRAGVHTDYGFLTILRSEDAPGGLQARARDGTWIDVMPVPKGFVVNIGDAMMRWTNDRWVSTPHRVVNPPPDSRGSTRRLSIAYFCNPNADALIDCLPGFAPDGSPAIYQPITYADYAEARYRQAHGDDKTLRLGKG